ncbi:MAG: hypothetical protein ACI4CT_09315 [Lachnospiraceae bacterium]
MRTVRQQVIAGIIWVLLFIGICGGLAYGCKLQGYPVQPQQQEITQEDRSCEEEAVPEKKEKKINKKKKKKKQKEQKKVKRLSFKKQLEQFPESYHEALQLLHKQHPNWDFQALHLEEAFTDCIEEQSKVGRNAIHADPARQPELLSMEKGSYDEATDTFTEMDAGGYYAPSKQTVAYYMDPRNFLNEKEIFQFESLIYDGSQKIGAVKKILQGSFMESNPQYAKTFMKAAKKSGVSPYHLATRVIQEVGYQGGAGTNGSSSYYNFYNIGANDDPNGGAMQSGLSFAAGSNGYLRPWNTPWRAIIGGAVFLGEDYINRGQNTVYFQKWSVSGTAGGYWHQYMTNIQAPVSEAGIAYQAYRQAECLESDFLFVIPVYRSMPKKESAMPGKRKNSNGYLKSIEVKVKGEKENLLRSFGYKKKSYSISVDEKADEVVVSAKAISSKTKIRGTGSYALKKSTVKIKVYGIAADGSKEIYTITIARDAKELSEEEEERNPDHEDDQAEESVTETESDEVFPGEDVLPGEEILTEEEETSKEESELISDEVLVSDKTLTSDEIPTEDTTLTIIESPESNTGQVDNIQEEGVNQIP